MAAAITEYINAYFKGGQHNRSVSVLSAYSGNVPEIESSRWGATSQLCSSPPPQMSGEDHGRPDHVLPRRHHPHLHGQPQRPGAQLPTGQHLPDRPLPAQPEAALQVRITTGFFFSCFLSFDLTLPLTDRCTPVYSDPSQSDPDTRDYWFNMQALQLYLQREAEANPQASYYNVGLLKYQVS